MIEKRTEGKVNAQKKSRDFYKSYKKSLSPVKSLNGDKTLGSYKISYDQHNKIIRAFNQAIIDLIILEAFEFILPYRMGSLRIKKIKQKWKIDPKTNKLRWQTLKVDWGKTNKLWKADEDSRVNKKLVYYTNDHSDGCKFRYFWSKKKSNCPNQTVYSFIATRDNKRLLPAKLKDPTLNINFFE